MHRLHLSILLGSLLSCTNEKTPNIDIPDDDEDGVPLNLDCDDEDPNRYPNAEEICDGIDNNCNGRVDEEVETEFFIDADFDGFGNPDITYWACNPPFGFTTNGQDCDDLNAASNPVSVEVCDLIDNNCDGNIDEGVGGLFYFDADGDGYGADSDLMQGCEGDDGYVTEAGDCDDSNTATYPGAEDICDGYDNDCDGIIDNDLALMPVYPDADGDGYALDESGMIEACAPPIGYTELLGDCDDNNDLMHPNAVEDCADGLDNDCSGDTDCNDLPGCYDIDPICWVCGDGLADPGEGCDDGNLIDGDGCDASCQIEINLGGLFDSWTSDGRDVYVFQSVSSDPLSDYDTFCEDRGLTWFMPSSESDAQLAIDTCFNYDNHHTWILSKATTGQGTWNGYNVTVNGPQSSQVGTPGFNAIRKWSSSYCDPEQYGFTRCWDTDHTYDWLLCQDL